jgi:sugar/nucleoside kinase (ribokinase family)
MLGGPVSFAAVTGRRLGWDVAVLTAAGPDFEGDGDLQGVQVVCRPSASTTSFRNIYSDNGSRNQFVSSRAEDIDLSLLPKAWRRPEALLLGPVVGEVPAAATEAFEAEVVGAEGQGWLREIDSAGRVRAREWVDPARDLIGVDALVISPGDLPEGGRPAQSYLGFVPLVALTRGWQGLDLMTAEATHRVPSLPRAEVDPTGAGDVFTAAFLIRHFETRDPLEAAAFAACAASSAVEGWGTSSIGDRAEVERRLVLRERIGQDREAERVSRDLAE